MLLFKLVQLKPLGLLLFPLFFWKFSRIIIFFIFHPVPTFSVTASDICNIISLINFILRILKSLDLLNELFQHFLHIKFYFVL